MMAVASLWLKKCLLMLLLVYVVCSGIFLFKNGSKYMSLKKNRPHNPLSHLNDSLEKINNSNTTRYSQNCYKLDKKQSYKICKTLPYSEIKCGSEVKKNKTYHGKPYVVPDVVFFIWFGENLTFNFYTYLALRSAAAVHQPKRIDFYYSISLPIGEHWERAMKEIPCLNLLRILEPQTIAGHKILHAIQRTDVARLRILLKFGGMYVDGDAITLKSLDPLRIYPATVGRATRANVCICIAMSKKNSLFMKEYYKHIIFNLPIDKSRPLTSLFTRFLGEYVQDSLVSVHIEESSINRPNPHVSEDGRFGTILRRMDISDNYFLHLHTQNIIRNVDIDSSWITWDDEVLRKLDTVYGEAARIALFGSPDLIFYPYEEPEEMKPKIKIIQFPPLVQRNAIIHDVERNPQMT